MNTTQLIQRAEALMSQGNPEEAGKIYEELCRMEQLTAAERGVALFGLGTCLFLHESYAAASLQLRESWELLIASLGMEDPLTTRTMVLLSRTLIALGDLESGMEIGRGALKNLVKLYGQDADQAATAAFFLSSGAYQFGRLAEAEELTLQALQAWEKIYGHVSLQAAACLDALGKLRNVCGENGKARISTVGPQTSRCRFWANMRRRRPRLATSAWPKRNWGTGRRRKRSWPVRLNSSTISAWEKTLKASRLFAKN